LATFSAALTYEYIPQEVIAKVKHLLLDTLGTTLAASTLGAGLALGNLARTRALSWAGE
jgi:2-methylcitrate dehydratase PrpD